MIEPIQNTTKDLPLERVVRDAFFPSSPAATAREAIFSDFLAEILGAKPKGKDIDQLRKAFMDLSYLRGNPEEARLLWSAFLSTYTITGERGARGKDPKRYVVPFHPEIAKALEPKESRPFGKWYIMLMSTGNPPIFNQTLHNKFVSKLKDLKPSNLLEKIAIEAAEMVGYDKISDMDTTPIRPYVEQVSLRFQEDLESWVDYSIESPSRWLQGVSDLLSFYMMMAIIQFSKNIHQEFEALHSGRSYHPDLIPIHFGEWEESASQNRDFAHSWEGRNGLEKEIFDSWGRLVSLRIISDSMKKNGWQGSSVSIGEAISIANQANFNAISSELIEALDCFGISGKSSSITDLSIHLAGEVTKYYEGKQPSLQSPVSMGINVVFQLGSGSNKQFVRKQNKIGMTMRLNTPAIIFFAKLFNMQKSLSGSYDSFILFMQSRGIKLDETSQTVIQERLEALGMLEKQSDSGESIYVRALQ